jgi:hypothetical protein
VEEDTKDWNPGICGEEPVSLARRPQILQHIEMLAFHSNARTTETCNTEVTSIMFVDSSSKQVTTMTR